ncbi:MAG: hypothetical protein ACNI3H_07445 [Halarcobacter ebronensis]
MKTHYSLAINIVRNRYSNYLDENDIQNIKNRVSNLLVNSEFLVLVKEGNYSKEQSLIYKNELRIIDLLVEKDNKYYIFDYKTTKGELQEHVYQVSYYKKAIKDILASDEVYSYIVYLNEDVAKLKKV